MILTTSIDRIDRPFKAEIPIIRYCTIGKQSLIYYDNWGSSGVYDREIQLIVKLAIGKVQDGKCDRSSKFWKT